MTYFLLSYDNKAHRAEVEPFDDRAAAWDALRSGTMVKAPEDELVLFITDSLETLKRTHPRYFYDEAEMAQMAAERIMARLEAAMPGASNGA